MIEDSRGIKDYEGYEGVSYRHQKSLIETCSRPHQSELLEDMRVSEGKTFSLLLTELKKTQ